MQENAKRCARVLLGVALFPLTACTAAGFGSAAGTVANPLQISSSVDAVNIDLSTGNCSDALAQILPLYNSANSTNSVRFATSAAYGCSAHINLLSNLNGLLSFQPDSPLGFLFELSAQEFPSVASPDDKVPQSAENGTDAVQAILTPGAILIPADTVNATSNNPSSLLPGDRVNDANSYLTFLSMALIGSLENRNAAPLASNFYHKSNNLPWSTPATTIGDGCAYVSAVLNFFDGLNYIETAAPANVAAIYQKIQQIEPQIQYGCCLGLQSCGFSVSCGASVTCSTTGTCSTCTDCKNCPALCNSCPVTLRSRASCTGASSDQNSCAAAGLVGQVNTALWSGPP